MKKMIEMRVVNKKTGRRGDKARGERESGRKNVGCRIADVGCKS
jgi:hypothetical protein